MDIVDSLGHRYPNHKDYPTSDLFRVVIENTSSQAVFIPREDDVNRALHLELITGKGKTLTLYQMPMAHVKYVADQLRLGPGEVTVCEVYYGNRPGDFRLPFPHDPNETDATRKVTIRAVFEQAPSANAPPGTWTGKAVSEPHEVELVDDL